ncbi:TetR/AcrR family transcriptional regulator [Kibdelosporangium philippinense]|uniref:TetR/AcrR family transcriptional regulator n=1 Tax=Kibdelosporangium philippinense TaxID=211113 RepID=A0ABS8Z5F8_9PSEU|nr:TetR/AcrR family transcriptional regulator [Kibdelosporangium philippinense]MCE7003090.1 TetR/AcrR family transcriptional regulator [Kibdelosporangium philippinense]
MARPREFDIDEALEKALHVFWAKGYEGAALSDLTEAMGINRPSMYSAFGNKETLFRQALDRYAEGPAAYLHEAIKEPTVGKVVERMLRGVIEATTTPSAPRGCLIVHGALASGDGAASVRSELTARRLAAESALRRRFKQAKDLPAGITPDDLARAVVVAVQGISVEAVNGATKEQLRRVADLFLRIWDL